MSPETILVLSLLSICYWLFVPITWRKAVLLGMSIIVLYSLQPAIPAPGLTFLFPTATLLIVLGVCWTLQTPSIHFRAIVPWLIGLLCVLILVMAVPNLGQLTAIIYDSVRNTPLQHASVWVPLIGLGLLTAITLKPTQPVSRWYPWLIAFGLFATALVIGLAQPMLFALAQVRKLALWNDLPPTQPILLLTLSIIAALPILLRSIPGEHLRRRMTTIWLVALLVVLYTIKIEVFKSGIYQALGASQTFFDWQWIGFSYVTFRLLHVLFDWRDEALDTPFSTIDFMTYVLFFPSILAGPISRLESIVPQINENLASISLDRLYHGIVRIMLGVFKKFGIAGALAIISLSPNTVGNGPSSPPVLMVMLLAALLQLFFDFAGYSDIAIGLGMLYGVVLPENFDRPLLRPNIQLLWQNWHATLSTWFRQYWFNPLTRRMMKTRLKKRPVLMGFIAQTTTMVLIGLWHSFSINWAAWGLYHGFGLWFYRQYADRNRQRQKTQPKKMSRPKLTWAIHVFLTVTYTTVGMSFIAFQTPDQVFHFWLAVLGR